MRPLVPASAARLFVAAFVVCTTAACTGSGDEPSEPSAAPPATALGDLDTSSVTVARADFCGAIPKSAAESALGAEVARTAHYGNGDSVELAASVTDVSHEFGCRFVSESGAEAQAWVFAPQVTRARARELVAEAKRPKACKAIPRAAAFGTPSAAVTCRGKSSVTASYRGLFGDGWLACAVTRKAVAGLPKAADQWCSAVLQAAR
ncbi:hypothetical protein [Nocardioides speluncae]|uniref:hypothetical protein n=1 Tax=Nocardioides speluncae TaxID=2670337 RepID=UPI000D69B227|nr:hypothetical protein [Nocardioides speluncae]